MLRQTLAGLAITGLTALSGCQFYFGEDDDDGDGGYTYCDSSGCWYCDDWGCYPDGGDPGDGGGWGPCSTNYDCAAGCACVAGVCEEWGFCSYDSDCMPGFVCDDRASCVPDGSEPGACTSDYECPWGTFCDEMSGACVGSWTCYDSSECGPGMACDDRGTCVPAKCTSDDQCLAGCYCEDTIGECVETGTCTSDAECWDGMTCDEARSTCVPGTAEDPGTCDGEITCTEPPPACPPGSTPGIKDGCYTGYCILISTTCTPPAPPLECPDIASEAECFDRDDCVTVYAGINCTCGPDCSCTGFEAGCVCESFEYFGCDYADGSAP
jgi:hypothetical protein